MDTTQLSTNEGKRFDQLEKIIEKGINHFVEVGTALMLIKKEKLYQLLFSTFEEYCRQRWGFNASRARQLIASAKVTENLKSVTTVTPTSEWQTRPLTHLEPEKQKEAWGKAVETAPRGTVTAKHIQTVVDEIEGTSEQTRELIDAEHVEPLEEDDGPIEDTIVLKKLKQCWDLATKVEKEAFLQWIEQERISYHDR